MTYRYSEDLSCEFGPTQMARMMNSIAEFERKDFIYVDAPWLVQQKVSVATKPFWARPIQHHVAALNHTFQIVASAEQSFLQMRYELAQEGNTPTGRWQSMTPCFRDETEIDAQHRIGFMKLELIDWNPCSLDSMIEAALANFQQYVDCRVILNVELLCFDIVSDKGNIELGSYGRRKAKIKDQEFEWVYGTGLAEPRLTVALREESLL